MGQRKWSPRCFYRKWGSPCSSILWSHLWRTLILEAPCLGVHARFSQHRACSHLCHRVCPLPGLRLSEEQVRCRALELLRSALGARAPGRATEPPQSAAGRSPLLVVAFAASQAVDAGESGLGKTRASWVGEKGTPLGVPNSGDKPIGANPFEVNLFGLQCKFTSFGSSLRSSCYIDWQFAYVCIVLHWAFAVGWVCPSTHLNNVHVWGACVFLANLSIAIFALAFCG